MARDFTAERNLVAFRDFPAIRVAVTNTAQGIISRNETVIVDPSIVDTED